MPYRCKARHNVGEYNGEGILIFSRKFSTQKNFWIRPCSIAVFLSSRMMALEAIVCDHAVRDCTA
jgi:hypothetical protein